MEDIYLPKLAALDASQRPRPTPAGGGAQMPASGHTDKRAVLLENVPLEERVAELALRVELEREGNELRQLRV